MPLTNIHAENIRVLTSLVNCGSAWKVPKGRRSASRRPRNIATKSLKNRAGVICSSLKQCNMLASESKKHDKSVLDGHLSDRAEQVPIKKRRFFLQSQSVPSTPQPVITFSQPEITEHSECQEASSKFEIKGSYSNDINFSENAGNINNYRDEKSENASEHFGVEDFSGKSTHVATTCSSSFGRDCGYLEDHSCVEGCSAQEQIHGICTSIEKPSSPRELVNSSEISTGRTLSCLSMEPVGELASLSTVNSTHKIEVGGSGIKTGSSGLGSLTLPTNDTCRKDEKIAEIQMSSSLRSRLHWDLNLEMDAWEHHFDDSKVIKEHAHNYPEDGKISHDDKIVRFERHDLRYDLTTTFNEHNSLQEIPSDPTLEGNKEKVEMADDHNISHPVILDDKSQLSHYNGELDSAKCVNEGANYMHHLESFNNIETVLNHGFIPTKYGIANEDEIACPLNLKFGGDRQCVVALESLSLSVVASSSEVEKQRSACTSDSSRVNLSADIQTSACVSSSQDIRQEVVPNVLSEDISYNELVGNANVEISSEKNLACTKAPDATSSKCESLGNLDSTKVQDGSDFLDEKLDGKKETTSNCCEFHPLTSKDSCNSVYNDACDVNVDIPMTCDKIDNVEDHGYTNDTDLNCNIALVVGVSAENKLQEDYDSQYEDGELRETREYHVDKEAEHLDYGEEDMEICTTSPTRVHVFEVEQVDNRKNVVAGAVPVIHSVVSNIENDVSGKAAKHGRGDESRDGNDETKLTQEPEGKTNACRSEVFGITSTEMATEVKDENLRNNAMLSYGDGLVESRGTETRMGSNIFRRSLRSKIEGPIVHDVFFREERSNNMKSRYDDSSCMRSFERFQYQGRGYGRDGTSDGCRTYKHHSPIGRRPFNVDGVVDREDIRSNNLQKFSSRGPSTFGRERPQRYGLSIDKRADRERYDGPSKDEIFQSSLKYRRPLSHRERSLSPVGVRGQYNSWGKSPSRSRSRSPLMCHPQRGIPSVGNGGNTFLRLGPNFADDATNFRSLPRNCISSPSRRRWGSDQQEDLVEFSDFGCKQRISALERVRERHSLRNIRRGGFNYRFSEDNVVKGPRYEASNENRRKHYAPIHPTRHNYEDGTGVRFQRDSSDNFQADSNPERESSGFQVRGIHCRVGDLARRLRGEKHALVYERDGKLDSNLNQCGTDVGS